MPCIIETGIFSLHGPKTQGIRHCFYIDLFYTGKFYSKSIIISFNDVRSVIYDFLLFKFVFLSFLR